jgi:methylenetetrahydrofolate reductase (NADPH)
MTIRELAEKKDFIVTSELTPPKGIDFNDTLRIAEDMSGHVDAINVTDGQSACMRMGSLALCHLLIEKDIVPVLQLTCRDRNRIALQSELLNGFALGVRNVLCLTGDHVRLGDHPKAKQVFDLDSVSLLWAVQKLNEGVDMEENALKGVPDLCAGAVVNPNASPVEPQLLKMERKIKAGARFFQTQAVFEISKLDPFVRMAREKNVPLLAGIMVLGRPDMARFINKHVSGFQVPEWLITKLENSEDPTRTGVQIAAKTINEAKNLCHGVHIMNAGKQGLVKRILAEAGISKLRSKKI